ncbi:MULTISPECIES: hypothetical protein [unclassified Streptomyces]|uniref:hypothetical protein n=1 Tax=unclassified Streptomyces TaxID=2593676 RepID=UPI00093F546A|nr:hypothetical protein [Streptomyces sp. TSRI0107]OKJ87840.1 hypothetical protein AMK31_11930 [Streptomyces sp. TSRI0107]
MTWSAALPGAAARVLRAAAGWRALQLAMLVGGLFLLGVLCGERAEAAEGSPASAERVTEASPGAQAPTEAQDELKGKVQAGVEAGAEAVRPLRGVVESVTRTLAEGQAAAPSLPSLPSLPRTPDDPSLPDLPELPEQPVPTPVDVLPEPQQPSEPEPESSAPAGSGDREAVPSHRADDSVKPRPQHGPHRTLTATTAPAPAELPADGDSIGVGTGTGHAPAHPAPADGDNGVLGSRTAADNGSSRHGDACAVTAQHRLAPSLVPGGLARAEAGETRDRYRDIPVFPG